MKYMMAKYKDTGFATVFYDDKYHWYVRDLNTGEDVARYKTLPECYAFIDMITSGAGVCV